MPGDDLATELEELWAAYLPLTLRRIAVIREAASTADVDADGLEAVRIAAHALVGALGLYGMRDAAAVARGVERRVGAGHHDPELLETAAAELEALVRRPVSLTTS